MEALRETTLLAFILQCLIGIIYIPMSYVGYRWARAPTKLKRNQLDLILLGVTDFSHLVAEHRYSFRNYIWPLLAAGLTTSILFAFSHRYPIQHGWWAGLHEEIISMFGDDTGFPNDILFGRILFWGWVGAYVYSLQMTLRHFMAYDLTPSVYVFTTNRFFLAYSVGAVAGIGVANFSNNSGIGFDTAMTAVAIVVFFVGFYPEHGLRWIIVTAQKTLNLDGQTSNEKRLSLVIGISIWQEGRLHQAGIENVQNLATVDLPELVVGTPFPLARLVEWVDQAIFLHFANLNDITVLEKFGICRASDLLANTRTAEQRSFLAQASGLDLAGLECLVLTLKSAPNADLVCRYRWIRSLDESLKEEAERIEIEKQQPVGMDKMAEHA